MVMYGGQIVEQAPTKQLLKLTKHPYTQGLLASLPNIDEDVDRLGTIQGTVPPAYDFPQGLPIFQPVALCNGKVYRSRILN